MSDRFFHPALASCDSVILDGAEAHHLIHVLRAMPGLEVMLFDGSGSEFLARVEKVERSAVRLTVVERRVVDRELPKPLTLGIALPKGDRQRWLMEKATELGVTQLTPLITERGVAQPTDDARRRLERAVIEASKQCGRNRLMVVAVPARWDEFVREQGQGDACPRPPVPCPGPLRLVAHPGGTSLASLDAEQIRRADEIVLAIGPEGGFSDAEVQSANAAGWMLVDLGKRILRVETAAIALVTVITSRIG